MCIHFRLLAHVDEDIPDASSATTPNVNNSAAEAATQDKQEGGDLKTNASENEEKQETIDDDGSTSTAVAKSLKCDE